MKRDQRGPQRIQENCGPVAPTHLEPATAAWWVEVVKSWELDPHHVRLLTLACEAWDRGVQAREVLAEKGLTFRDRFEQVKARPEVGIERDARIGFARLLRELDLDTDGPAEESRPPLLKRMR